MPTVEQQQLKKSAAANGSALLKAVSAKQYPRAKALLQAGAETTWHGTDSGYYAIHYAIAANSTAGNNMLQILLNHQADPNSQYLEYAFSDDSDDSDENPCVGWITPLHLAVEVENTAAITLLLNAKASCAIFNANNRR